MDQDVEDQEAAAPVEGIPEVVRAVVADAVVVVKAVRAVVAAVVAVPQTRREKLVRIS